MSYAWEKKKMTEDQKVRGKQIIENIRDRFNSEMAYMRTDWQRYEKNYRGVLRKDRYKGSANLFVQETHNAVETIVSRIKRLILSIIPPFNVRYEGPVPGNQREASKIRADVIKAKFEKQWRNAGVEKTLEMFIRKTGLYGTGIMKYFWDYQRKTVIRNGKEESVTIYDDVMFENKDPFNMFLIGQGQTADELEMIMERSETTMEELKKHEKGKIESGPDKGKPKGYYQNLDEVPAKALGDAVPNSDKSYQKYDLRYSPEQLDSSTIPVELYELWLDFDLEGKGKKIPCVITMANGVVIRVSRNPYHHQKKPYIICPYIPVPNTPWGIGICELIKNDQAQINTVMNQMVDDGTFTLHNMWLRNIGCPTLKSHLKAAPMKVFDVRNENDIIPLRTAGGQIMATGIQLFRLIRDNIMNTTGAQAIMQGAPARARTTATEVAGMERHGMNRVVDIADRMSELVIKPMVEATYDLDKQFLGRAEQIPIKEGKEVIFRDLLLSDLDYDYKFEIITAMDTENKMIKQQQFISFLNIIRGFPPQAMASLTFALLRRIWESFGFKDSDEVITPQDEQMMKQLIGAPNIGPAGGVSPHLGQVGERAGGAGPPNVAGVEASQIGGIAGAMGRA